MQDPPTWFCEQQAAGVRDRLAARGAELIAPSSARDYQDVLHAATVVVQSFRFPVRDDAMAENLLWVRDHRGRSKRIIA